MKRWIILPLFILLIVGYRVATSWHNAHALDGSQWQLSHIILDGEEQPLYSRPLVLSFEDSKIRFSDACNSYFGGYKIERDIILIDNLGRTGIGCMGDEVEAMQKYFDILIFESAQTFKYTNNEIVIVAPRGSLQYIPYTPPPSLPLVSTLWNLTVISSYEASTVRGLLLQAPATLMIKDGKATGTTGCNDFTADVMITDDTIQFRNITQTQHGCPDGFVAQQERELLAGLASAQRYSLEQRHLKILFDRGALEYNAK